MNAHAIGGSLVTETALPSQVSDLIIYVERPSTPGALVTTYGQKGYNALFVDSDAKNYARDVIEIESTGEKILSVGELKNAVSEFFKTHDGDNISLSNLMERFPCSLHDLVTVCQELEEEKKIAKA